MKKFLAILVVSSCLITTSFGQTFKFGAGPALSLPIGNLADINGLGIGVEVTGILEFSENFEAFGQAGYSSFMGKTIVAGIKSEAISHIPVLFGARYKTNGLLIGAGLGYGSWGKNSSGFNFSPQVGYSMNNIDIIGHYSSTSVGGGSLAFMGIKAYYKF